MVDVGIPELLAGLVAMSSGDERLDTLIRLTCGRVLSLAPLPTRVDMIDRISEREAVVVAFAEQFATDVSGIGAHQRKQLLAALGDKVLRTVTAIFIADFVPRVWAGFDALGMGKRSPDEFAVVKRAPLIVPPDFDLRPPEPGAPRPNVGSTAEQARVAVCHAFGFTYKRQVSELLPYGIYTIPEVSCVGLSEEDAIARGMKVFVGKAQYKHNARGRIIGDLDGKSSSR